MSTAGRFWGKTNKVIDGKPTSIAIEIDILAADKGKSNYILGECKFKNETFDLGELKKLQQKFYFKGTPYYYLFALSGFTDAVKNEASTQNNISLFTLSDLFFQ